MIITSTLTIMSEKGITPAMLSVWGAEIHGRNVIIDDSAPGFISFARTNRPNTDDIFVPSKRLPMNAAALARRAALEEQRLGIKPGVFSPLVDAARRPATKRPPAKLACTDEVLAVPMLDGKLDMTSPEFAAYLACVNASTASPPPAPRKPCGACSRRSAKRKAP